MTWAGAWALLRRFWWAVPLISLSIALLVTRTTLADTKGELTQERADRAADAAAAEKARLLAEAGFATRQAAAAVTFADRIANREPIILRATDTVRTYAQTDAGRAACLAADRVQGIDDYAGALFADDPGGAVGSREGVSAGGDAPPSRRVGQ